MEVRDTEKKSNLKGYIIMAAVLFVVIAGFSTIFSRDMNKEAHEMAENYISASAFYPESLAFSSYENSTVDSRNNSYMITGTFSGRTASGVIRETDYTVGLKYDEQEDTWELIDLYYE